MMHVYSAADINIENIYFYFLYVYHKNKTFICPIYVSIFTLWQHRYDIARFFLTNCLCFMVYHVHTTHSHLLTCEASAQARARKANM